MKDGISSAGLLLQYLYIVVEQRKSAQSTFATTWTVESNESQTLLLD